jgi:hypothetical protein
MSLLDNGAYWRARSNEARITADCVTETKYRRIMLDIAAGYDQIAGWIETRETTPASLDGRGMDREPA